MKTNYPVLDVSNQKINKNKNNDKNKKIGGRKLLLHYNSNENTNIKRKMLV